MPELVEGLIFILVLVAVVVAGAGAVVYAIAARGRQKQLSTKGGSLDAGREPPGARGDDPRPEHREVEDDQRTRFVGSR